MVKPHKKNYNFSSYEFFQYFNVFFLSTIVLSKFLPLGFKSLIFKNTILLIIFIIKYEKNDVNFVNDFLYGMFISKVLHTSIQKLQKN